MPNWVMNQLTVVGDSVECERFWKAIAGPDNQFIDFNKIVPLDQDVTDGHDETEPYFGSKLYWHTIRKWGTKWNASCSSAPKDNTLSFDTAWAAPFRVIEQL